MKSKKHNLGFGIKDVIMIYLNLVISNKSTLRVAMERMLKKISESEFKNKKFNLLIDIGSRKRDAKVNQKYIRSKNYFMANIEKNKDMHIIFDATKQYPFQDSSIDMIISFNVMEHLFDYKTHIKESYKVIKDNGYFLVFVPFSMYYHADPHDYWRFTRDSLEMLFSDYFRSIKIIAVGLGPFSCASQYMHPFISKIPLLSQIIRLILYPFILGVDYLLSKMKKLGFYKGPPLPERFPLGYFVIAKK